MKNYKTVVGLLCSFCGLAFGARVLHSQEKASPSTVQVHMVITDQAFSDSSEVPVVVRQNFSRDPKRGGSWWRVSR
jgi:hypothetical protein